MAQDTSSFSTVAQRWQEVGHSDRLWEDKKKEQKAGPLKEIVGKLP